MRILLVFLCLFGTIYANSFANKKIIKLQNNDDFNIIKLNQNVNYDKLSQIDVLALVPSYEKEYNFYFSNLKIDAKTMAKDTLNALNALFSKENHLALLSQKENQVYINSQNILQANKHFINADDFLEFNRFKKADFVILLDLKKVQASQHNFLFFSNFDVKIDLEYKVFLTKTNKLKDHKLLTIDTRFNTSDKSKSYEELVQEIAKILYEDIKNTI
ncbi:hypothetical protein [Campylobacter subantarcticus]|uniref:Uncharacterized protein n=1 Tax=Campylobacter subantarcticus LMG 24374 TaxID=1388751 RepID=A0A0A8HAZ2_9BACT|nr:hypothetical protein [Campylobacter subantarcticus]AJC90064.1 hypothetical protein CSUB8521_0167 [Campylobacter subantarcticus LMG 24374]EAJ1261838.1 hypothetical protein [Campylobacter lari]